MGNRITKIYTRTGDNGETGLGNGERVSKSSLRIQAIGDVDELNCAIGLTRSHPLSENIDFMLARIQHQLFDVGGELAMPGYSKIQAIQINELENHIDQLNKPLTPLKEFILPGGSIAASNCHMARAICRRTERTLIQLNDSAQINIHIIQYLNRLSDLLFVLARVINKEKNCADIYWNSEKLNTQK